MKTFLSYAAAALLMFNATSCNNDNPFAGKKNNGDVKKNKTKAIDHSIVGKWEPVDIESEEVTEAEKKDILENASIEFTRDGRYYSLSSQKRESGSYTYDETDMMLTTVTESGRKEELKISWLKDKLVMTFVEGEGKVTMSRSGNREQSDEDGGVDDVDYSSASPLTGKWRVIMSNPMVDQGEENTGSSRIEFRSNGTYFATTDEEGDEPGTYSYDKSEKTLVTTADNGDREQFEVEFQGKNKIVLTYGKGKLTLLRD